MLNFLDGEQTAPTPQSDRARRYRRRAQRLGSAAAEQQPDAAASHTITFIRESMQAAERWINQRRRRGREEADEANRRTKRRIDRRAKKRRARLLASIAGTCAELDVRIGAVLSPEEERTALLSLGGAQPAGAGQ